MNSQKTLVFFTKRKNSLRFVLCSSFLLWLLSSAHWLKAEEDSSLAGQLLVATPELRDPNFIETVIYIIQHDENGAMGLVINRPLARGPLSDLLKGLKIEDENAKGEITLHYGGPVNPEFAFVLHSDDYIGKGTTQLSDGLAVTRDPEIMHEIAKGKGPRQRLFIVGYSGWGPGQLEAEIKAGGWFSIGADTKFVFDRETGTKWERALEKRKIKT